MARRDDSTRVFECAVVKRLRLQATAGLLGMAPVAMAGVVAPEAAVEKEAGIKAWIKEKLADRRIQGALNVWQRACFDYSGAGLILGLPHEGNALFVQYEISPAGELEEKSRQKEGSPANHDRVFARWLVDRIGEAISVRLDADNLSQRRQFFRCVFSAAHALVNAINIEFQVIFEKPLAVTTEPKDAEQWLIQEELARRLGSSIRSDNSYIQPSLVIRPQLRIGEEIFPGMVA